jgi:hypothetical protein
MENIGLGCCWYCVQRLGGWRTGAMVERYAHLAPEHLATAAKRLDAKLMAKF